MILIIVVVISRVIIGVVVVVRSQRRFSVGSSGNSCDGGMIVGESPQSNPLDKRC